MFQTQRHSRAAVLFIVIGIAVLAYSAFFVNVAEASEAAASPSKIIYNGQNGFQQEVVSPKATSPWNKKDANGNREYQECGQDCTYQKANENLIMQSRYIQMKNVAKHGQDSEADMSGEEAYHRFLLLKIGSALGKNSQNAANLRSTKEGLEEARDVPSVAQYKRENEQNLKPLLPNIQESKDIARAIQSKIHDPAFVRQLKIPYKEISADEFAKLFAPNAMDFYTFKQVHRDVGDASSDMIWTAAESKGPEFLKAKAEFDSVKDKALKHLQGLQKKIREKYEKIQTNGLALAKGVAPTLEDYLIKEDGQKMSDADFYRELRNSVAQSANTDIQKRYSDQMKFRAPSAKKVEKLETGPYGLLPQNKQEETTVRQPSATDKAANVYLTDKMSNFDAAKYESFKKDFMRTPLEKEEEKKEIDVAKTGSR